jgi:Reverse transcriptase (RNA-dependent DNA polymerase)
VDTLSKLEVAWRRVRRDRRTDFIVGDFEYDVYERFRDELLATVATRIDNEGVDYHPEPLRTIRVPKDPFTTRPGSAPVVQDRLYYQSLVDDLAQAVEGSLTPIEDGVPHSYRYAGNRKSPIMFHGATASHGTFSAQTRKIADAFPLLVVTDVSSFYERIYHHNLENTIRGLGAPDDLAARVMALLRKWQRGTSYGIPQGIWSSDYLGNLYLDPVDKLMVRSGRVMCRYVDDIRFGAHNRVDAERGLLTLEEQLSSLGLSLNSGKTHVIPSEEVEETLFPYKPRFDEIFAELRTIFEELQEELLGEIDVEYWEPDAQEIEDAELQVESESIRQLLREELQNAYPNPSVVRFCLKKLRSFGDASVLTNVLNGLPSLVLAIQSAVPYILHVAEDDDEAARNIQTTLSRLIEEPTAYDWQLMWYLQCLLKLGRLDTDTVSKVRTLLMNRRGVLHDAVTVNALLLVGRHGDDADRSWISGLYDNEHSLWIKRAILYSIRRLVKTQRNHFYAYCRGADSFTDRVIDYCVSDDQM